MYAMAWRRSMFLLTLIASLLTGVVATSIATRVAGEYIPWIDGGLYVVVTTLCAGVIALRAMQGGDQRTGWAFLAACLLLFALGDAWVAAQGQLPGLGVALPLEDLFWLAFYPLAFLALWQLIGKELPRHRNFQDALVVAGGVVVVLATLIQLWLSVRPGGEPLEELLVGGLYVTGDLALMAFAFLVAYVQRFRVGLSWWLIIAAFLTFAVADTLYWIENVQGSYVEGSWLDLAWLISFLALATAALMPLETLARGHTLALRGSVPASLAVITEIGRAHV